MTTSAIARLVERVRSCVNNFWNDTSGLMLPYMTVMLTVLVGFSLLAIDGSRYFSLQTQMQEAADALALAGARELDQTSGAQTRAINAMANAYQSGGAPNTLSGMGSSPTLTYSYAFYSAIPSAIGSAASALTGTAATGDADSKYLKVVVSPQQINTIIPVKFINPTGTNSFSAGATAIAGFTAITICNMPPVYVCNPYETAGMTDQQATAALRANLAPGSWTLRQMLRLAQNQSGPGQFGLLIPPDGCTGASCLSDWVGRTTPQACYTSTNVNLNPGQKNSVAAGFNVRFDIYSGGSPLNAPSSNYAPSVNVRKGFVPPWNKNGNWCVAAPAAPYYTTQAAFTSPIVPTSGTTALGSTTITLVPSSDIANINQMITACTGCYPMITGSNIASATVVTGIITTANTTNCTSAQVPCITISQNATGAGANSNLTIKWETSGLPLDTNLLNNPTTSVFAGNGQWDCATYWKINHPTNPTPPTDMGGACDTPANTTVSRYQVYRYEIANSGTAGKSLYDWSGNLANQNNNQAGNAAHNGYPGSENGAPYCAAANGVSAIDTQDNDRRRIAVAVINCLAQANLIGGGATAQNIPTAGFAEVFLTQPVQADGTNYLYAEMTCLIGECPALSNQNNHFLRQVQLYR